MNQSDTLDSAQDIVGRLLGWIDELEQQKDEGEGITSEWVADATKLVAQANTSLRLVGQLKKRNWCRFAITFSASTDG